PSYPYRGRAKPPSGSARRGKPASASEGGRYARGPGPPSIGGGQRPEGPRAADGLGPSSGRPPPEHRRRDRRARTAGASPARRAAPQGLGLAAASTRATAGGPRLVRKKAAAGGQARHRNRDRP